MNLISKSQSVVTIGTFDGVHIGHQIIINHVMRLAQQQNLEPVLLTLFPHPRMVLNNDTSIKLLNTIEERISVLESFGIKTVVKAFDKSFANLSAESYVKSILVEELRAKYIVIGYDHHFGKNRSANITDLKQFSETLNFQVQEISAQDIEAVTVSSTKIRTALNNGEVALANSYLGYAYFITGIVTKGKGIGRTIGYPTANIFIESSYKLIPKNGVYVIQSEINNTIVYGMMNIGTNPTVNGEKNTIEAHFFNFNADIYGCELKIEILKRLRSEHKFENLEALKSQLKADAQNAITFITSQHD